MSKILGAFAAAVLIASAAAAQTAAIAVTDVWARATPGKAENGAAYLTIESPSSDRLTGVSTPVAKTAELHMMTMEGTTPGTTPGTTDGGVMRMRPLAGIDLPPGRKITLKPGGAHIMLVGLHQPLRPGESFPLTLHFEKAGAREVAVAVLKPGMAPESHTGPDRHRHMQAPAQMPMPAGR